MFVHLSAFENFSNLLDQNENTSELSPMATKMVSATVFSYKEIILAEQKSW